MKLKRQINPPTPLGIALVLSLLVLFCSLIFTLPDDRSFLEYGRDILGFWYNGFWSLLSFTMQMMMILVLGHVIALSPLSNTFVFWFLAKFSNIRLAITGIALICLIVSWINWGLGLILGAVLVQKLGEFAQHKNLELNYSLAGAAGYCGLMFWHGGLSGSAPLTLAQDGHFLMAKTGIVSTSQTIFSSMNLWSFALIIILVPLYFCWKAGRPHQKQAEYHNLKKAKNPILPLKKYNPLLIIFGGLMISIGIYQWILSSSQSGDIFSALNLDFVNFLLFGFALLLSGSFLNLENSLQAAASGGASLLLQFPLYAGIMGVMKDSGLIVQLSDFLISIASEETFSGLVLVSASMVNLVVPSGGGQWVIQGPIVIEAAQSLGIPLYKAIMAFCYGDQLTNMIQPFWAIPLLAITQIKAHHILPYSFKVMLIGFAVYAFVLLVF